MTTVKHRSLAQSPHIGIIGAGISGLRCADVLLSKGYEVSILEARDRIGGRICQSDDLGYKVDLGPNWIHASTDSRDQHVIYNLALASETPVRDWNKEQTIYDPTGKVLSLATTNRLSKVLWQIIEDAFRVSAEARDRDGGTSIPRDASLQDYIEQRALELLPDQSERKLLLRLSDTFSAYVGESVSKQSLRFAWMEECCGSAELFVESTYSNILQLVAKRAVSDARILLNHDIVRIRTPDSRARNHGVKVWTANGDMFEFDDVVVTTPLGWLKHHLDAFSPPLPQGISRAIQRSSLSNLEKVFVHFPRAFWASKSSTLTTWLSPEYAQDTNPARWSQEMWDVSSSQPPNNHSAILFYIYGDCARYIVNTIHDMSTQQKHQFLDDFFRPYYSRLQGYNADDESCHPQSFLATEWLKDKFSGFASYSNFQVGAEASDQDTLVMRHGCPERCLWLCGEHIAPFDECGTVNGAYLSGELVAERIAEAHSNRKTSEDLSLEDIRFGGDEDVIVEGEWMSVAGRVTIRERYPSSSAMVPTVT